MFHMQGKIISWALVALLATAAAMIMMVPLTQPASADHPAPSFPNGTINANDYAIFAQATVGKAGESSNDGSNNAQVRIAGSNNSAFGRIGSNADYSASGQNNFLHFPGNTPEVSRIHYDFEKENGENKYTFPLGDPRHPGFPEGTGLPSETTPRRDPSCTANT